MGFESGGIEVGWKPPWFSLGWKSLENVNIDVELILGAGEILGSIISWGCWCPEGVVVVPMLAADSILTSGEVALICELKSLSMIILEENIGITSCRESDCALMDQSHADVIGVNPL